MEENKLLNWYNNINNGEVNDEVLIINFSYKMKFETEEHYKLLSFFNDNIRVRKFKSISLLKELPEENCIYLAEMIKYRDIKYLIDNDIKIILVKLCVINEFYHLMKETITSKNYNYSFIEKIDFKDLIFNKNIKAIIKNRNGFLPSDFDLPPFIRYKFYNEFKLLIENRILTTSFAHKLYRFCYLDNSSTETQIGINIRKTLNVKSRSIPPKELKKYLGQNSQMDLKQTRIYDLNINQIELDTKIKIAKNLIALKKEKLNVGLISKVTELPEIEVIKIWNNYIRSSL